MVLFKDLSSGLITEPSPSGTTSRAGSGFGASEVPLLQGVQRGQGLGRGWLLAGSGLLLCMGTGWHQPVADKLLQP